MFGQRPYDIIIIIVIILYAACFVIYYIFIYYIMLIYEKDHIVTPLVFYIGTRVYINLI